jgi:hypothetical protein
MNTRSRAMRAIALPSAVSVVALAAVMLTGCSGTGSTAVHATSDSPATLAPMTSPLVPTTAPVSASTPSATPTVTVTVNAPAPSTVVVARPASTGPFQSPSGNISCTMFAFDGQNSVRCEIADYSWVAPPPSPDCHLNWGSRFKLEQSGAAVFDCSGAELPAPEQTLAYGETRSLGAITCESEPVGMTCTDSSTGHYFRVSRETYELG